LRFPICQKSFTYPRFRNAAAKMAFTRAVLGALLCSIRASACSPGQYRHEVCNHPWYCAGACCSHHTECPDCDAGRYSPSGDTCYTCPDGHYSNSGSGSCASCPAGKKSNSGRFLCENRFHAPFFVREREVGSTQVTRAANNVRPGPFRTREGPASLARRDNIRRTTRSAWTAALVLLIRSRPARAVPAP
jgi:hypothetical protein